MGKIDQLRRITMLRIDAFLSSLEKPEYILPQLLKEIAQQVKEATDAKAKALSAVKGARRRLDEANGKVHRLENGAKLAVQADDMEIARQAIAAQIEAEQVVKKCQAELETTERAHSAADKVCMQLVRVLEQLKTRKKEIQKKHRYQVLTKQMQKKYIQSIIQPDQSILDAVSRIEEKIEQQEIELQVQNELSKTLGSAFNEERVQKLEHDAEVDSRLEKLKNKLKKGLSA
jgi:phage shock protein A